MGEEKNAPKFNKENLWNHWTDLDQVKTIRREISSSFLQLKNVLTKFYIYMYFFKNTKY